MIWIFIAYLLGLIFLAPKIKDAAKLAAFRAAWISFALIPLWQFLMQLFRAGNLRDSRTMELIEIWNVGVPSLLFGISLFNLLGALAPANSSGDGEHSGD